MEKIKEEPVSEDLRKIFFDIEHCKRYYKTHPSPYGIAKLFLKKDVSDATTVLYSFCRYSDNLVDVMAKFLKNNTEKQLWRWWEEWESATEENFAHNPIINATNYIVKKYNIPIKYFRHFLESMRCDAKKVRIQTHQELMEYIYGASCTVAMMMTYLLDPKGETIEIAKKVGYAMHITNMLKDIKEDIEETDRIYLPAESMALFGVTEHDIINQKNTDGFKNLVKFYSQKARNFYREAEEGILSLPQKSRLAVETIIRIYEELLSEIEKREFNVFAEKIYVPSTKKLKIISRTVGKLCYVN